MVRDKNDPDKTIDNWICQASCKNASMTFSTRRKFSGGIDIGIGEISFVFVMFPTPLTPVGPLEGLLFNNDS